MVEVKTEHQKGQIGQLKTTSSQQLYITDTVSAVVISKNVETQSYHSSAYNLALSCNFNFVTTQTGRQSKYSRSSIPILARTDSLQ